LADANHEVAEKYGVWQQKSLYGRKFRASFVMCLIGAEGKVANRWDDVTVDSHADDASAAVGESA
jgi:peroxiredoxin Q/BCP